MLVISIKITKTVLLNIISFVLLRIALTLKVSNYKCVLNLAQINLRSDLGIIGDVALLLFHRLDRADNKLSEYSADTRGADNSTLGYCGILCKSCKFNGCGKLILTVVSV